MKVFGLENLQLNIQLYITADHMKLWELIFLNHL